MINYIQGGEGTGCYSAEVAPSGTIEAATSALYGQLHYFLHEVAISG